MFGAPFSGDHTGHFLDQVAVPGAGQAYGLGENGGQTGTANAMERFIPPVVRGHAQPFDGRGAAAHLADFLADGHPADQIVDALGEGTIVIQKAGRILVIAHVFV
jgi:hypothetical protein